MLDIILLLIFAGSLLVGLKRGFIVQAIHLSSFFIALLVAYIYYKPLAEKFVLWVPYPGITQDSSMTLILDSLDVDQTFYRIIAFAVIFFVVKLAMQILASVFDFLKYFPILNSVNRVLGAALCFVEFYFILFIIMYVLALIPISSVQNLMGSSIIANLMLEHTPILTKIVQNWWYIYK
ncbi:CvpA family protein [Lysinibacillus endophyticus]|uniref:CvpA family protein n=1 Tax=Ureibacillus endophyticus TaxID=1978490 RepID=A0A494ZBC8_9BACL|nr:CvpA family protein [Lysinibacillus endophyticus]MCP1145499.1 CvpA family protein [Lysinibacillus endophyticus]RKQ20109.1 CvpA family protein [Lysinibacillus endophyticus]